MTAEAMDGGMKGQPVSVGPATGCPECGSEKLSVHLMTDENGAWVPCSARWHDQDPHRFADACPACGSRERSRRDTAFTPRGLRHCPSPWHDAGVRPGEKIMLGPLRPGDIFAMAWSGELVTVMVDWADGPVDAPTLRLHVLTGQENAERDAQADADASAAWDEARNLGAV